MCCLKALTYWVTKCVVWRHYCNEWQNVLFESTTVPSDKTCCWKHYPTVTEWQKCVVWQHYPTVPSDKMCCLKALPYHTEWQNVLFESINLPSAKMCCLKALTYWVTKCVVWKHYCNEWQNVLFESTTVPSDKTCCWKHYPTIPSDKNVLFESINLPSDKMCCSKALTYQVTKCVVWKH